MFRSNIDRVWNTKPIVRVRRFQDVVSLLQTGDLYVTKSKHDGVVVRIGTCKDLLREVFVYRTIYSMWSMYRCYSFRVLSSSSMFVENLEDDLIEFEWVENHRQVI